MASRKRTEPVQDDLFNPEVELLLPARLAIEGKALGSPIRQLAAPPQRVRCRLRPFSIRRVTGHETTLPSGETLKIINAKTATSLEAELILLVPGASEPAQIVEALDAGEGRWMAPLPIRIDTLSRQARVERLAAVSASWSGAFHLREGRAAENERPAQLGLRRPQIGALHAALAHATRSIDPATIVMPTGTGKTETMLALNVHQRFERLLVVVPTDALREQIAGKFETFGVLRQQQCLEDKAAFPVVMRLSHIPTRLADVDEIFDSANVIVTTMQISGRAEAAVQERMAGQPEPGGVDLGRCLSTRLITSAPRHGRAFGAYSRTVSHRSRSSSSPPHHSVRTAGASTASSSTPIRSRRRRPKAISSRFASRRSSGSIRQTPISRSRESSAKSSRVIWTSASTISPWRVAKLSTAPEPSTSFTARCTQNFVRSSSIASSRSVNAVQTLPLCGASRAGSLSAWTCSAKVSICRN